MLCLLPRSASSPSRPRLLPSSVGSHTVGSESPSSCTSSPSFCSPLTSVPPRHRASASPSVVLVHFVFFRRRRMRRLRRLPRVHVASSWPHRFALPTLPLPPPPPPPRLPSFSPASFPASSPASSPSSTSLPSSSSSSPPLLRPRRPLRRLRRHGGFRRAMTSSHVPVMRTAAPTRSAGARHAQTKRATTSGSMPPCRHYIRGW